MPRSHTDDICIEDIRSSDYSQINNAMSLIACKLTDAVNQLMPGCGVEIVWLNIPDKTHNPIGNLGSFELYTTLGGK